MTEEYALDLTLNPELRRFFDAPQASKVQMTEEYALDLTLNPELRRFFDAPQAKQPMALSEPAQILMATSANAIAGEWICDLAGQPSVIRMNTNGRIVRVSEAETVYVSVFWFSDGELHIMSSAEQADDESVFHATMETTDDGTFLNLEQCGGNCADAAGIQWLQGLERIDPTS